MINHLELTKFLNELRMKNTEMPIREFRKLIRTQISYSTFPTLLMQEGYAYSINNVVRFSTIPIHREKVRVLIKECRESQYSYNEHYRNKEQIKQEERNKISECIQFLTSKGYTVLHKDTI